MNLTSADLNTLNGWHTAAEQHLLLRVLLNTRRTSGLLLNLSTTMIFILPYTVCLLVSFLKTQKAGTQLCVSTNKDASSFLITSTIKIL